MNQYVIKMGNAYLNYYHGNKYVVFKDKPNAIMFTDKDEATKICNQLTSLFEGAVVKLYEVDYIEKDLS